MPDFALSGRATVLARLGQRWSSLPSTRWLAFMLLALHAGLVLGTGGGGWARTFLLAHYGFFLLWQPFIAGAQDLDWRRALPVVVLAVALVLIPGWWLVGFWVALLCGLTAAVAASLAQPRERAAYLLALGYLLGMLLIWIMPRLLPVPLQSPMLEAAARWGLPLLPFALLFWRAPQRAPDHSSLDFFYGLMVFLMVVVLALGAFALVTVAQVNYALALVYTLLAMAALLLALSLLWNPRAGFAGLGQLLSRYLLSVGLPFEGWTRQLARLAEREREPERFVAAALAELDQLGWVRGVAWRTARGEGTWGDCEGEADTQRFHGLELVWHSTRTLPPALALHVRLMSQLLGYFYASKVREQALRENAYTQAIHDTGARLTHDVKNILQSMKTLLAAAEVSGAEDGERLISLMKRQLPQLVQRLQNTVEKLRKPEDLAAHGMPVSAWWQSLQLRYAQDGVDFRADDHLTGEIPQDLFDSVADNLLTNALRKRKSEKKEVVVSARVECVEAGFRLEIVDSGKAAPEALARQLFQGPVPSSAGLGIGLYQAARQAARLGYCLRLAENRSGRVAFVLERVSSENADFPVGQNCA